VNALDLADHDLLRVCRDLAYSEIAAMPGALARLGSRTASAAPISWASEGLNLDSLARMQLATAAAVWCNAYDAGFEDLFLAKRNVADWAVVMRRAREAGAKQFTFATSGSTGARKHVRHREDILAHEAQGWAQMLQASQPVHPITRAITRAIVLCPTHHIYGFIWGVLVPLALGVPALDADLDNLPALLPGDLVVAVPDQWAWLATGQRTWPADVQGVSSTAPMPAQVHDALTTASATAATTSPANPALARLLQIYGSTETAGLAYRSTSTGPYTLAAGRVRNSRDGIDLQAATIADGKPQPMAVQDELQWQSATTFNLLRRSDESVQVGGHNVSPAWVITQLQQHSAVKEAAVRLDASLAQPRLKAFVVLKSSSDTASHAAQCNALEQWMADTLPWYAAPSSIHYGSALPRNAMGKLTDWQNA
jgi:long-chain acyl-CoA synthetase